MWWWEDLADALLDRRCPGCAGRVPRGRSVCDTCESLVPRNGTLLCLSCLHGDPQSESTTAGGCPEHGSKRLLIAGPRYEPPLDRILHAFKYSGARGLDAWIATLLPEPPGRGGPIWRETVLVPVPLHPARRARRGFDQALLLAERASIRWGIPVVRALSRIRDQEAQATLDPVRRRSNIRGAFCATNPTLVEGRPVVVVDDVATTGSTLLEAAAVLEEAGAAWIVGISAAHGGLRGP